MEIIARPDVLPTIISLAAAFISLALLAWLRTNAAKYLADASLAVVSEKRALKMWNEKSSTTQRNFVIHNVILLKNFSVLFFQLAQQNSVVMTHNYAVDFLIILAATALFFTLKVMAYLFVGFSFSEIDQSRWYSHNVMIIYRGYGFILFPVIIAVPFFTGNVTNAVFVAALVLFAFSQILIFVRAYTISRKTKFSILYLFLYLCALEIIPVLFVVKISGLFFL